MSWSYMSLGEIHLGIEGAKGVAATILGHVSLILAETGLRQEEMRDEQKIGWFLI